MEYTFENILDTVIATATNGEQPEGKDVQVITNAFDIATMGKFLTEQSNIEAKTPVELEEVANRARMALTRTIQILSLPSTHRSVENVVVLPNANKIHLARSRAGRVLEDVIRVTERLIKEKGV